MELQLPKYYWKRRGLTPPICYKPAITIRENPPDKWDSLKVNIKTQSDEKDSAMVEIYVLLFWTGSPEALLKFVMVIDNIIQGQGLSMGPQKFGTTMNLVVVE